MAAVDILQPFSPALYNELPDVVAQDNLFQSMKNSEDILREIAVVFNKHHVDPYFGVFLLHIHSYIENNQCMIERQVGNALITAVEPIENLNSEEVYPSRWKLVGEKWIALEYTSDPTYKYALNLLSKEFLSELATVVVKNNITELFGLCLAKRTLWPNESQTLAEHTDDRGNVVIIKDVAEVNNNDFMATIFCFGNMVPKSAGFCFKVTYCQKIGPAHVGINGHKKL